MQLLLFPVDLFDEKVTGVKRSDELVVGFGERAGEFPRFSGEGVRKGSSNSGELCPDFLIEKGPGKTKARSQDMESFEIESTPEKRRNCELIEGNGRNITTYEVERAPQILLSGAVSGYAVQERGPPEAIGKTLGEPWTGQEAVEFGVGDKEAQAVDTKRRSEARNAGCTAGFLQKIGEGLKHGLVYSGNTQTTAVQLWNPVNWPSALATCP